MKSRSLIVAALLLALGACRSKDAPAPAASVALAEAPSPASLVAELSVGNPKETWGRVRQLGGGVAQALPTSLAVLLTTSLSLPPAAAGSFDESVPIVGALLSRKDATEPDVVLGMHVVSGAELVASLTLGDGAKFRRLELGPRLVRLLPAPGAPEFNGALGVSGNYLLLATGLEPLREAGRFVAEGVAKRARQEPGLTLRASESVLSGLLSRRLREQWQARRAALAERDRDERKAKGRAPDFADPEVLLAGVDNTVESWLSVLETSRELSLQLAPEADRLRVDLSLLPGREGAAALLAQELVTGSGAPLLQLPSGTTAALLFRGDAQPGASASPNELGESVAKLFGERLDAKQARRLTEAFRALSTARHGATVFGLMTAPPSLLVTCELANEAAFNGAVADVVSLLELPPVARWLDGTLGKPTLALAKTGHARVRFQRPAHAAPQLPSSLSLSWETRGGIGYLLLSPDEGVGLRPFAGAQALGASAWLSRSQGALSGNTALSLFADARMLAPGGPDEAPVLLTFGKKDDRIALALDVSSAALPALARLFALDRSP